MRFEFRGRDLERTSSGTLDTRLPLGAVDGHGRPVWCAGSVLHATARGCSTRVLGSASRRVAVFELPVRALELLASLFLLAHLFADSLLLLLLLLDLLPMLVNQVEP
jgi:hypothetical protein